MAFSYTGAATNPGSGTSASVTHGQSIGAGDLVVAYVNSNSTTAISADAGTGATWLEAVDEQPSPETARQALYWKIANGTEDSAYSFTVGDATWRVIVKVFTSVTDAVVDAAATTGRSGSNTNDLVCIAIDGAVISDNAVSIICGGKDNRSTDDAYVNADNSYVSALGDCEEQAAGMAHRIYTTDGLTFSGNVIIDNGGSDSMNDRTYSVHISFVESAAGPAVAVFGHNQFHNTLN